MFPGKYHQNGAFSMAMLVYQRVLWVPEIREILVVILGMPPIFVHNEMAARPVGQIGGFWVLWEHGFLMALGGPNSHRYITSLLVSSMSHPQHRNKHDFLEISPNNLYSCSGTLILRHIWIIFCHLDSLVHNCWEFIPWVITIYLAELGGFSFTWLLLIRMKQN